MAETASPGAEVVFELGASGMDSDGQVALVPTSMAQGVQDISIIPVDPTVTAPLIKVVAAGGKVVLRENVLPDWAGKAWPKTC